MNIYDFYSYFIFILSICQFINLFPIGIKHKSKQALEIHESKSNDVGEDIISINNSIVEESDKNNADFNSNSKRNSKKSKNKKKKKKKDKKNVDHESKGKSHSHHHKKKSKKHRSSLIITE